MSANARRCQSAEGRSNSQDRQERKHLPTVATFLKRLKMIMGWYPGDPSVLLSVSSASAANVGILRPIASRFQMVRCRNIREKILLKLELITQFHSTNAGMIRHDNPNEAR